MKKYFIFVLAVLMLFSACGCKSFKGDEKVSSKKGYFYFNETFIDNIEKIEINANGEVLKTFLPDDEDFEWVLIDLSTIKYKKTKPTEGRSYHELTVYLSDKTVYTLDDFFIKKSLNDKMIYFQPILFTDGSISSLTSKYV